MFNIKINKKRLAKGSLFLCCVLLVNVATGCSGGTYGTGLQLPPVSSLNGGSFNTDAEPEPTVPYNTSTIKTRLKDAAGNPVKGFQIFVESSKSADLTAITDEDGEAFSGVVLLGMEPIKVRVIKDGKEIGKKSIIRWKKVDETILIELKLDTNGNKIL